MLFFCCSAERSCSYQSAFSTLGITDCTFLEKEKYQKIFALPGRGKGKSKDAASAHYGFRAFGSPQMCRRCHARFYCPYNGLNKSVGCSASKFFGGVAHVKNVARFRAMASFAVTRLRRGRGFDEAYAVVLYCFCKWYALLSASFSAVPCQVSIRPQRGLYMIFWC